MSFKELNKNDKLKIVKQYESETKKSAFNAKKQYTAEFLQYAEKVLSTSEEDSKEIKEGLKTEAKLEGEDPEVQELLNKMFEDLPPKGDNWKKSSVIEELSNEDFDVRITKEYKSKTEGDKKLSTPIMSVFVCDSNGETRIYVRENSTIDRFINFFSDKIIESITPAIIALGSALVFDIYSTRMSNVRFSKPENIKSFRDFLTSSKNSINYVAKQCEIFNASLGYKTKARASKASTVKSKIHINAFSKRQ